MYLIRHIVGLSLLLFLVGCSAEGASESQTTSTNKEDSKIVVSDFAAREVTFSTTPQNIVTLGKGETDIVYALGNEVVGRPTGKVSIAEAEEALEVGSTHSLDIEKITSLSPDIVFGNHPMNQKDVQSVEQTGAEMVLTNANSVADIQAQITLFGQILSKENAAQKIVQSIDDQVSTLQSESSTEKLRVLLIYGAPGTHMAALPNSLSGNMLELVGGENIAADYPSLEQYPQYAQINTERIIESNPQLILLMSHGNPEEVKQSFIDEMSKNAGWSSLDAVRNDAFHILPDDLFGTNPGTKVVDALDHLDRLLQEEMQ